MAKKNKPIIKMTITAYVARYHPDLHRYARAYLRGEHNVKLKTKAEWDKEMISQGLMDKE